jgi:hypothetical protein
VIDRWRIELTRLEHALAECGGRPLPVEPLGRLLMEGVLHVVPDEATEGCRRPAVHVFGGGVYVAAYTSAERMRSVMGEGPRLALPGPALLRAVPWPAQLILNVGTWPSRVLAHWELSGLLARWERMPPAFRVAPPRHYPAALLEALWDHFQSGGAVAEGHLAEAEPEGCPPRPLIAFRSRHPALAERLVAQTLDVASAVYDAEVHVHHLGGDEVSRRIVELGTRFFGEPPPAWAVA